MSEPGFLRRVTPAIVLAAAGGVLLYLLPTGADKDAIPDGAAGTPGASSTPSNKPSHRSGSQSPQVIQGDPVNFQYGTVQVEVTLQGTTITDITTITAPGGSFQPYTDRAIPTMKSEILAAQSTQVAAASGATYTSEAYAQSVQSALDKA
jgi:uncharacterized protein with FMN-binding domain